MKPLLFLDVDGVLNVLDATPEGFREKVCNGFLIRYDPENAGRLARLAEHFELVWGTTWENDANRWIAPLFRLRKSLPVCELPILREANPRPTPTWKLRDILAYAGGRPFAWVDDHIYDDAQEVIKGAAAPRCMLVRTEPQEGLTEKAEKVLIAWACELAGG